MTDKYDIEKLLGSQFLPINVRALDKSYQQVAANTGAKKAKRYEKFLRSAINPGKQGEFTFLSIGGADGSEIEYVASKFGFKNFILCEASSEAAKQAEALIDPLADRAITLTILVGDIWHKRHEIEKSLQNMGQTKLVVSAQSVLHELPTRSAQTDFAPQFLQLISYAKETILLTSDPTGNTGHWPEMVNISSSRLSPEDLFQLACLIHAKYYPNQKQPTKIGDITYCYNKIALETFYKIAHFDGNARLQYELGECLSCFPREKIERILTAQGYEFDTQMWQSDRLRESYSTNFTVRDIESGDDLPLPETFLSISAKKK